MGEFRNEVRMAASAVAGLLFGRTVWLPPEAASDRSWIGQVRKRNVPQVCDVYRDRLKIESDGIESVRRRSEFAITAIVAAVGLSSAAFERLWDVSAHSAWPLVIWATGLLLVLVSVLIFAGVAVSKKVLGVVEPGGFAHHKNFQTEELRSYVIAVETTSRTRRALVTVFRDGFLITLVGLALLGTAHAISWTVPFAEQSPPIVINVVVDREPRY